MSRRTYSLPSCFNPTESRHPTAEPPPPPPPPPVSGNSNLTTCLYRTHIGHFSLTWSRSAVGRTVNVIFHQHNNPFEFNSSPSPFSSCSTPPSVSLSTFSLQIQINNLLFWKKSGSKQITNSPGIQILWDFSKAKFGSGPEPVSGFYVSVVVDKEIALLVGDCVEQVFKKSKARKCENIKRLQLLVMRREHVFGSKSYITKAKFGGKMRVVCIDCRVDNDARLICSVDNKKVLQIKRLKWKFRGNERIEVDGVGIQVSWDVYNWLFESSSNQSQNHKHAVFMFKFDKEDASGGNDGVVEFGNYDRDSSRCGFGMNMVELRKMRKALLRTGRSSSSSSLSMSLSSASSACSSSVMEWASSEENELCSSPAGFTLLVYAWKK